MSTNPDVRFYRYPATLACESQLDLLKDALTWISFLRSEDYVVHCLRTVHRLTPADSKIRAKQILPHACYAVEYIEQALGSRAEVSFLPAYYGLLNLAKIVVLLGPRHADLQTHRWHGVAYDGWTHVHRSVLTERVILKRGGALALYYETLVGIPWPADKQILMADMYPYLYDAAYEYNLATGRDSRFASVVLNLIREPNDAQHPKLRMDVIGPDGKLRLSQIAGLKHANFEPDPKIANRWLSKGRFASLSSNDMEKIFDRRFAVLNPGSGISGVFPTNIGRFKFTEELPIILSFFHMSSVVRYNPEFMARIADSTYWPLLAIVRRHSLLKFILLFLSHVNQKTVLVNGV